MKTSILLLLTLLPTFSYSQIDEDKYDYIGDFSEKGHASWVLVRNGELYGFIDRQGKEIVKLEFEKIYTNLTIKYFRVTHINDNYLYIS